MQARPRSGGRKSFNTQPPEGGWPKSRQKSRHQRKFQHTAARRRLAIVCITCAVVALFQHTAARRRLARAAKPSPSRGSFNTQPPEGGWAKSSPIKTETESFNTQPPEGGWLRP